MLKDKNSSAIVAVKDIAAARGFYVDTLGLEPLQDSDDMLVLNTGSTQLVVYVSDYAGTNKANAVAWGVGEEIEAIVSALLGKGVSFEHYPEMPGEYSGGIHSSGDFKAAWFKDPDGNILHLNNM
ncbi:VOC family protein [Devosia oryziradicis]|uniref:VOC family protein n=1 Tax=Devosia oryziradicis TaxID=2801335 RepID=A0ABX7BW44_9HYPH|nr:VOC family protein [Devosia oryziradicis]QQR36172.1 VOC family protein [Devosia oryziradicis]